MGHVADRVLIEPYESGEYRCVLYTQDVHTSTLESSYVEWSHLIGQLEASI